jgi:glutathione S-transferase
MSSARSERESRSLYAMPYSPWSERARWALLHHRLPFREVAHLPLVGELALRARVRRLTGKVSVPLLVDGDQVVMDSFHIARYVDTVGRGTRLIPEAHAATIAALNTRMDVVLDAGRARLLELAISDPAAALEFVPAPLRALPFAVASSRLGFRFVARKYGTRLEGAMTELRAGFVEIRKILAGKAFVFDAFTYADVLAATALEFLEPVEDRYVPLGPATRQGLSDSAMIAEFADLVAWRDALYAAHRPLTA